MKNFNAAGLRARNEQKREAARVSIVAALRAAGAKGLTQRDLIEAANVSDHTVRKQMPSLRVDGLAHIGPWELHGAKLVPTYVFGPGIDAKRADFEHLLGNVVIVDIEQQARKEAKRKHEKWAKTWRPHRPAEAAWF